MTDLYVEEFGAGPAVVLVHGSGAIGGARSWSDQLVLADRYRLVIPDRRGYGRSPTAAPSFERDAVDVAELLDRQPALHDLHRLVGRQRLSLSVKELAGPRTVDGLGQREEVRRKVENGGQAVQEMIRDR